MATAMPPMKKQITAIHDATLSWSVPLIPWPLVQPPARRAPKAMRMPPPNATAARKRMLSPKRAFHMGGSHSLVNSPPVSARKRAPSNCRHHKDKFPAHARRVVFEISEGGSAVRRYEFAKKPCDLRIKRGCADGLVRKVESQPGKHSDRRAYNVG